MGASEVLPPRDAQYGTEQRFAQGFALRFPDFQLRFLGIRTGERNLGRRLFAFEIGSAGSSQEVTYGVGGALLPTVFDVGGRAFELDLVSLRSDPGYSLVVERCSERER